MPLTSQLPANAFGAIPYRLQLAGGWIDQPFMSRFNPRPPGSMVVVQLKPTFRPMDRSGFAGSTRATAMRLWKGRLPRRAADALVRELYAAENRHNGQPSGSQDMIGLVYPGVSRLDYDFAVNGGVFPAHLESLASANHARWLEAVTHLVPIAPRPEGYNPLGVKRLSPRWVERLGQTGRACFEAIRKKDLDALGDSLNETMRCWEKLLPHVVAHPSIRLDLKRILKIYQGSYPGAMFSGCGGGYLIVVSKAKVPGSLQIDVSTLPRS